MARILHQRECWMIWFGNCPPQWLSDFGTVGIVSISICTFPKQSIQHPYAGFNIQSLWRSLMVFIAQLFQPYYQLSWVLLSLLLTSYASFPSILKKCVVLLRYHPPTFFPSQPSRGIHPTEHMQLAMSSGSRLPIFDPLPCHCGLTLLGRGGSECRYC